jgi:SAM-dependent methyltransferase
MKVAGDRENGTGRNLFDVGSIAPRFPEDERITSLCPLSADEQRVADYWHQAFVNSGRIWGTNSSQTATSLIALINEKRGGPGERIVIAEIGCGYGRDAAAFAKAGFDVQAVDIARQGLLLAKQEYDKIRLSLPGRIRFFHGTILTLRVASIRKLDGLSCHRALHLMTKAGVLNFARCAAELLRPGGFISIGARSPADFDPKTMDWVGGHEGEVARYKDPSRCGHVITFLGQTFLESILGPHFTLRFSHGQEEERAGGGAVTRLIYVTGTRRSEG